MTDSQGKRDLDGHAVHANFTWWNADNIELEDSAVPAPIQLRFPKTVRQVPLHSEKRVKARPLFVEDLMNGSDEAFVRNAYEALLMRAPDVEGMEYYLARLRNGTPRVDVLSALCRSSEAKVHAVRVRGLALRRAMQGIARWPLLGDVLRAIVPLDAKSQCHAKSLSAYRGEAFIRETYRAVLGRSPDPEGLGHYRAKLLEGYSKGLIIRDMRRSREGKAHGAYVAGLMFSHGFARLSHIPVLGNLISMFTALLNASQVGRRLRSTESRADLLAAELGGYMQRANDQLSSLISQFELAHNDLVRYTETRASRELHAGFESLELGARRAISSMQLALQDQICREELQDLLAASQAEMQRASAASCDAIRAKMASELAAADTRVTERLSKLASELARTTMSQDVKKANVEALHQVRNELASELHAADARSTERLNRLATEVARTLTSLDAEKVGVQTLHQIRSDLASELEAVRQQNKAIHEDSVLTSCRALETKAERSELTSLANHLIEIAQSRVTERDLSTVKAALESMLAECVARILELEKSKATVNELETTRVTLDGALSKLIDRTSDLEHSKATLLDLDASRSEWVSGMSEVNNQLSELRQSKVTFRELELNRMTLESDLIVIREQGRDLKLNVLDQQRRLSFLLSEVRKRLPEPLSTDQMTAIVSEEEHELDALYASLEDRFRGTRADIKGRQSIYLPHIRSALARSDGAPVLDLGCGRGEWLELLGEGGLVARGVDSNRVFVDTCKEQSLNVTEADVISHLRELKPNSIGAITAFHLVEHIDNKALICLLDESLRVLKPGGILVLETPNPKNLIVGSCNFYLDPTHRHPLPPALLQYLVEARGFIDIEVQELHPFTADYLISDGAPKVNRALNEYLFGARDYCVIGRKS
ncbi:DUF4214 domain-containing protein [Paraburkholderia atlantica]|uniref:DUF4214 domain-containing protein n=1 Tax=Paraburkholderia atlantica TaxID=2654982 RepID=UPI003D2139D8